MLCKKDLLNIRENTESRLVVEVIDIILDEVQEEQDLDKYLDNVLTYGLNTGMCTSLLYTADCRKFVQNNIDEVLDIYNITRAESSGIPEELDVNYLAWLAFESICSLIKNNQNIEDFVL